MLRTGIFRRLPAVLSTTGFRVFRVLGLGFRVLGFRGFGFWVSDLLGVAAGRFEGLRVVGSTLLLRATKGGS